MTPPRTRPGKLSARQAEYLKQRIKGRSRTNAVRAAGYHAKDGRSARGIACQIEAKVHDLGILDLACVDEGVDQRHIAKALGRALKTNRRPALQLRAVEIAIKLLGYDRPREETPKLPDIPVSDVCAASIAIGRYLQSLATPGTTPPSAGQPGRPPDQ